MKYRTGAYFHNSVSFLLGLGALLYFLFALDICTLSDWNLPTLISLLVGTAILCSSVFTISYYRPEETDVIFSTTISTAFVSALVCVCLGLHFAGNPKGSFVYILIISLAITEVNFVFDRRFVTGLYVISFLALVYGIYATGVELTPGFRSIFGFSLLFIWKTLNQIFHRKFVYGKENKIKHDTFHSTVNTLQNELNNTSHIIMGFSQMMEGNQDESKKKEYLGKINNGLDKMSTQIKKIRELEEVVVDDKYTGKNFIRID
ncbi:MAG: hypothetical protein EP319_01410 [Deltaproteobacteria bacterium]|nr:MAG: hypothetical protein EP319_01410 [Deltaproteobacteria bacterium]